MNFKTREAYKEHVAWCTEEMHDWLINDEELYLYFDKVMKKKNLTMRDKAGLLRDSFRDFHNGQLKIGPYVRFTDIVKNAGEEYENQ